MTSSLVDDVIVVYDGAVEAENLAEWQSDLEALFARMGHIFHRPNSRKHAQQYLRGLLSPLQRKNGWTMAEYAGELEPKALQRFLNLSPWDADELLALNREYAVGFSPTVLTGAPRLWRLGLRWNLR